MADLRSAPGYAEMEDYYDSDYVPHELLERYHAVQLELRKRTEQQFVALSQANGLAVTYDGLAATASLPHLGGTSASATEGGTTTHHHAGHSQPQQHRSLTSNSRSPHGSLRQSIGGLARSGATRSRSGSNSHHRAPRPSMQLEELYAARRRSHSGVIEGGGAVAPYLSSSSSSSESSTASAAAGEGVVVVAATAAARPNSSSKARRTPAGKQQQQRSPARSGSPARVPAEAPPPPPSDLYDAAAELRRQEQFLSESRRLGKPFVPSGGSGLDMPTRFMLGDCVKRLYRSIAPDWRAAAPMVVSTAEDLIAVYFSLEKLSKKHVTALLEYMNASLKYNDAIREFHLTKVPEGWDVLTDDGYVLYTFRPPWVRKRAFLPDTVSPPHAHD